MFFSSTKPFNLWHDLFLKYFYWNKRMLLSGFENRNVCFFLIFCIRLQLQPGPLHSLSPGRLTISPQPKSLKRVYQQVIYTEALASPSLLISKGSIWTHTLLLFHFFSPRILYFPHPSLLANATTTVLHFNYFSVSPSSSSSRFLLHKLSAHLHLFFMLVSLRLSSFYTVASEECGHRRLER